MLEIEDQLRCHADWLESQMPPLVLPSAGPASGDGQPLLLAHRDLPIETPSSGSDEDPASSSRRTGRGLWAAVAATALVALVVASLVVVRSRTDNGVEPKPVKPTAPSELPATERDSVVLPASTPEGFLAADVTTNSSDDGRNPNIDPTGPPVTQLFGAADQPRLEVRIDPTRSDDTVGGGTAVAVRGVAGVRYAPGELIHLDQSSGGSMSLPTPLTQSQRYSWTEHDAIITAAFVQMTPQQALELVDHLRWVSDAVSDGFVLPGGSGLVSLLPPTTSRPTGLGLEADADYLVAPADATHLRLVTCPGGAGSCPGVSYDFASAWLLGTRASDGSAIFWANGRAPEPSARQGRIELLGSAGVFVRMWPDGAAAEVDFGTGATVDVALARRLTDHLVVTDGAGLDRLQKEIAVAVGALPVAATADLTNGRVEVHAFGALAATCFAPAGSPLVCGPGKVVDPTQPPTGGIQASLLVDGHWWVAVSSTDPGPIAFASGDSVDFDRPAGPPLPGETAAVTAGATTYQLGLVEVPDDVTGIMVTQSSSPGNIGGGSVERPTS
jgi:hypothetical protein